MSCLSTLKKRKKPCWAVNWDVRTKRTLKDTRMPPGAHPLQDVKPQIVVLIPKVRM